MNANQLSEPLGLDYKTVRQHLRKLEANDVVTSMAEDDGKTYILTERMEANIGLFDEIAANRDPNH